MNTTVFTRPATLLSRLDAAAATLSGKKGVIAARELATRIRAAAAQHAQQMRIARAARTPESIVATRRWIDAQSCQTWRRGPYEELGGVRLPKRFQNHPALKGLAAPLVLFERAQQTVLPTPYAKFDRKGRGSTLSLDLYGFGWGLLLVQVRTTRRETANGFLAVRKDYLLTDGCTTVDVPPHRIKRAAAQDESPDSPIRALKPVLPAEWAARIDADPLKLAVPHLAAARLAEAFKVVEQREDGALVSVYDGSQWPLSEWRKERARREHGGGLYAYATPEDARKAAGEGVIFNRAWVEGKKLVLVRCEVGGGVAVARYGNKIAFNALKPVEVLGELQHG